MLTAPSDAAAPVPAPSGLVTEDFFGVADLGGSVAVQVRWRPDATLRRLAEGEPIRLASRVRSLAGALLVADGPRSRAVDLGQPESRVVVPLSIPSPPAVYVVELDPVLEGRWWGSWHGFTPATLTVERGVGGDLVWRDAPSGAPRVMAHGGGVHGRFRIPHERYGADETERCVEVPWVLSRYAGQRRVLDVGHAHAEPRYVQALAGLGVPFLVGLDLASAAWPGLAGVVGDARHPPFAPATLDLVLAVSIVEHVGRDNSRYVPGQAGVQDEDGDLRAVRALAGLLAPGGRLLVTVPFGAFEDHGWFVQYDARRLRRLIDASRLELDEIEFYRYATGGWQGPVTARGLGGCRYGRGTAAAAAVACVALRPRRRGRGLAHHVALERAGIGRAWTAAARVGGRR